MADEIESLFFECYAKQMRQNSVLELRDFRNMVQETIVAAANRDNSCLNTDEVTFEERQDVIANATNILEKMKICLNE